MQNNFLRLKGIAQRCKIDPLRARRAAGLLNRLDRPAPSLFVAAPIVLLRLKGLPAGGRSGDICQRIDNIIPGGLATGRVRVAAATGQAELEQTKLLPIRMEAVGFGIDRHPVVRRDLWKQFGKLRGIRDQTLYFKLFEQHPLSSKTQTPSSKQISIT